jgi:hypothetical protein
MSPTRVFPCNSWVFWLLHSLFGFASLSPYNRLYNFWPFSVRLGCGGCGLERQENDSVDVERFYPPKAEAESQAGKVSFDTPCRQWAIVQEGVGKDPLFRTQSGCGFEGMAVCVADPVNLASRNHLSLFSQRLVA